MKEPRYEDYDIKYRYKNRFAFLGNGDMKAHATGDTMGLARYVRATDHDWQVD
jgi:hypothetical protein